MNLVPMLACTSSALPEVFEKIEAISRRLDPSKGGIRIVADDRVAPDSGSLTFTVSNAPLHEVLAIVCEVSDTRPVIIGGIAVIFRQADVHFPIAMVGVYGRCTDADSGDAITNLAISTSASPGNPDCVRVARDGTYVAAVPFFVAPSYLGDCVWFSQEGLHPQIRFWAPGFETNTVHYDITPQGRWCWPPLNVQLKRKK